METAQTTQTEEQILDKLSGMLDESPPEETVEASAEPESDEPTPEDIPDDTPNAATEPVADFELVYNGEPIKVAAKDAKELAQLGYHFKQNEDRFSQQWGQVEQFAKTVQEQARLAPELDNAKAELKAYEIALAQYNPSQLAQLAVTDPAAYVKARADWDALAESHKGKVKEFEAKKREFDERSTQAERQRFAQESEALRRIKPHLRDQARLVEEHKRVGTVLESLRFSPEDAKLVQTNHRFFILAADAARYQELQKAKAEKIGKVNALPKVVRPGATQMPGDAQKARDGEYRKAIKSAKSDSDKAALVLDRLAQKFG